MRRWVENVFHLGLKELASLSRDVKDIVQRSLGTD